MKVNISDLMDEYTPGQELDLLEDGRKMINLKAVKNRVNKTIVKSERGQFMRYKTVAACICGVAILFIGGVTVNAATHGALFNSFKVFLVNEDGTKEELNIKDSYVADDGSIVYSLANEDGAEIDVSKEEDESVTTIIKSDESTSSGVSVGSSISSAGEQEDMQIYFSVNGSQSSELEDIGIDIEKYNDYEPGTYEETNSDGVIYEITVSEDRSVYVHSK